MQAKPGSGARERRKRLPLNCGECRKQKLSCDRAHPCGRCIRSGRQHRCAFETRQSKSQQASVQQESHVQQAQRLTQYGERASFPETFNRPQSQTLSRQYHERQPRVQEEQVDQSVEPEQPALHPGMRRTASGYYARHSLFKYFYEIPDLFPFIGETSDEWLKPKQIYLKKLKPQITDTNGHLPKPNTLESASFSTLLPPQEQTDFLVSFYLDHFEQIHRVVHVPTFRKSYASLWDPSTPPSPSFLALVLSMLAISACASPSLTDPGYRAMPLVWLSACDKWLKQQGFKSRQLIYYQVACLAYFARRINKKRYWSETGALIQNALIDGLDSPIANHHDMPYQVEIKRRIWHVLRELDLHNCFEYGLPTMLHNIDPDMPPPANVDDLSFKEDSLLIPASKPEDHFTRTSYQLLAATSWSLRLEVSRRLFSPASSTPLSYDEVLNYTHKLMQAIDSLPDWSSIPTSACDDCTKPLPVLANAFLQIQLKECILALHRGYLGRERLRYSMSETVYFQAARDMLVLHQEMGKIGLQSLLQIREDLLLGALSLTRITMLQPLHPTSLIAASADATLSLMEECLAFMAARYSRSCNNEPWCFITMCATIMVLKVHLGKEIRRNAKYLCATRFMDLHESHSGKASPASSSAQQHTVPQAGPQAVNGDRPSLIDALGASESLPAPDFVSKWLDDSALPQDLDLYMDVDIDLDQAWQDDWPLTWPT